MTAIIWPDYIIPNSVDFWLDSPTKSGGQSILGVERIIASPSARWRATLTFRVWGTKTDPRRLLWWRSFAGRMNGRAGSILIGPFDTLTPARLDGSASGGGSVFGANNNPFADMLAIGALSPPEDGTTFTQSEAFGVLTAAAAANAQVVAVKWPGVGQPMAGQYFGLGGTSLYLVNKIVRNSDATLTLTFSPGLRAAANTGDVLDFEKPKCTMRLFTDDAARAKTGVSPVADTTLDLVEVL